MRRDSRRESAVAQLSTLGAFYTRMDASVRNLLYRNPEFYELAYPEPGDETPTMCRRMFARYLAESPRSILDIGCGTARDLDSLSRECPDCWGVDCLPEMIGFAKARRPHLHLEVGDMSTLRLGRTFDVIMSMGSALMYALTNADVARAFDTFVAHAHTGTLLILDINNAASYLSGDYFKRTSELQLVRRSLRQRRTRFMISTGGVSFWSGGGSGRLMATGRLRISVSIACFFQRNLSICSVSGVSESPECLTTCSCKTHP